MSSIQRKLPDARILIYSHDTYGLGHLRRCRAIAQALVQRFKGLSILIISGSPIIGRFEFAARVDFVRIPGVIKLYNGDYTSLALHIDIKETLSIRESIIYHTAKSFAPNIFLVDKEPLGLQGEVSNTLKMLKDNGCTNILGLRDVMDDPQALQREWDKKGITHRIQDLYHQHWVYGPAIMGDPLDGMQLPVGVKEKNQFTGYIARHSNRVDDEPPPFDSPFLLVTPGGGGDGVEMVEAVIKAYQHNDKFLPWPALIVLGPFMPSQNRQAFIQACQDLPRVKVLTFDNRLEHTMAQAAGIVAMGGYNTFCEIMTLNKKALVVPRTHPRMEQYIRADKAQALGLLSLLPATQLEDIEAVTRAIQNLATQDTPIEHMPEGFMRGLDTIADRVEMLIHSQPEEIGPPE